MSRWKEFSDLEIYMMSRACIESCQRIQFEDTPPYEDEEKKVHNDLLNELILERRERNI